ncbi:hypothetical protein KM043_014913 [Ampulex compressa]|nr:hypothetical protein KM043_014913 [Ampulex compressa]
MFAIHITEICKGRRRVLPTVLVLEPSSPCTLPTLNAVLQCNYAKVTVLYIRQPPAVTVVHLTLSNSDSATTRPPHNSAHNRVLIEGPDPILYSLLRAL